MKHPSKMSQAEKLDAFKEQMNKAQTALYNASWYLDHLDYSNSYEIEDKAEEINNLKDSISEEIETENLESK